MASSKNCPNCGYPNRQEARYCISCGTRLAGDSPAVDAPSPPAAPRAAGQEKEAVAPVVAGGRWQLIDRSGGLVRILPYEYNYNRRSEVDSFHEGFARVRNGTSYGYIDKEGRNPIPTIYEGGLHFSERCVAVKTGQYWCFLDGNGSPLTPAAFTGATEFREGLAAVQMNGKWGYINHDGDIVHDFIFDYAGPFSGGLAVVGYGGGFGHINKRGQAVLPSSFREGGALARYLKRQAYSLAGRARLLDTEGGVVSALPFRWAFSFSEDAAVVQVEEKTSSVWKKQYSYRYIDRQGEFLQLGRLDALGQAGDFSEGIAAMSTGRFVPFNEFPPAGSGSLGYYNRQGQRIYPACLDVAHPFREGLAFVSYVKNGIRRCGFINRTGRLAIDYSGEEYTIAGSFSNGLAPVGRMERGSWRYGFINPRGANAIPFKYDRMAGFGV
jgi:hypothetical protein